MRFSVSTFTVEINGVPIFVFRAKKHIEAEEIYRDWADNYLDDLVARGALVYDAASSVKLRLAHPDELVAYQDADEEGASPDGVRLVYLVNLAP